jgi:hypothetical protein
MKIIFNQDLDKFSDEFILLELDTFFDQEKNQLASAYCLIEQIPMDEYATLEAYKETHHNLLRFYRQKHWTYCEHAIEKLMGKWNGEVDTFYSNLLERIQQHKQNPPAADWTGYINQAV